MGGLVGVLKSCPCLSLSWPGAPGPQTKYKQTAKAGWTHSEATHITQYLPIT